MTHDLFDTETAFEAKFQSLLKSVPAIAKRVTDKYEFPDYSIGLYKKENKTETVYPIELRELKRNVVDGQNPTDGRKLIDAKASDLSDEEDVSIVTDVVDGLRLRFYCDRFVTVCQISPKSKNYGTVLLKISPGIVSKVPPPASAVIKTQIKKEYKRGDNGNFILDGEGKKILIGERITKIHIYISLGDDSASHYLERIIEHVVRTFKSKEPKYGCCHLYKECSDARRCLSSDKMYATACQYRGSLDRGKIFYGDNRNV